MPHSNVLWDTIWSDDPALGTMGDWNISGMGTGYGPLPPEEVEGLDVRDGMVIDDEESGFVTMEEAGNSGGLQSVDPIGTAILLCIASDARLPDYMIGRFGFTIADQQEWHGNTTSMEPGEEPLGSLLWTLRRAPLTPYTAKMAEHFCAQALQVMVRQKLVQGFEIRAEIHKPEGRLAIHIRAVTKDGERQWTHDLYAIQ